MAYEADDKQRFDDQGEPLGVIVVPEDADYPAQQAGHPRHARPARGEAAPPTTEPPPRDDPGAPPASKHQDQAATQPRDASGRFQPKTDQPAAPPAGPTPEQIEQKEWEHYLESVELVRGPEAAAEARRARAGVKDDEAALSTEQPAPPETPPPAQTSVPDDDLLRAKMVLRRDNFPKEVIDDLAERHPAQLIEMAGKRRQVQSTNDQTYRKMGELKSKLAEYGLEPEDLGLKDSDLSTLEQPKQHGQEEPTAAPESATDDDRIEAILGSLDEKDASDIRGALQHQEQHKKELLKLRVEHSVAELLQEFPAIGSMDGLQPVFDKMESALGYGQDSAAAEARFAAMPYDEVVGLMRDAAWAVHGRTTQQAVRSDAVREVRHQLNGQMTSATRGGKATREITEDEHDYLTWQAAKTATEHPGGPSARQVFQKMLDERGLRRIGS